MTSVELTMRTKLVTAATACAGLAGLVAACGHGAVVASGPANAPVEAPALRGAPSGGSSQYIVADPSVRADVAPIPVGSSGAFGLCVDKARIVAGRGEPRVGTHTTEQPLAGARAIPSRMGGGYLFWTDNVLYRAETFDGALEPLARLTDSIQDLSLGPKFVLVRTHNGERWALGVKSGERVALEPIGALDIEGLDDGRALAFDDRGNVLASTDAGARWVDVTSQVKSAPKRVAVIDEELWLIESSGSALRLETDGQLSTFDKPPEERPVSLRPRDPRWHGVEAPLRAVFHYGASIDDSTAIVVERGDVVRVDVRSGEIVGVAPGKLPPDAQCEAVPIATDVLFACVLRTPTGPGGGPSAFVVSHTLGGDAPVIEQTFQSAVQFFGSDDGGLAAAAPCVGTSITNRSVCVRQPGGSWQDHDVAPLAGDAGAGDVTVARWVPRSDGRAVALVTDPTPGVYDPRTGHLEPLEAGARELLTQGLSPGYSKARRHVGSSGSTIVDWSWSFGANGALRGWQRHGGIVEMSPETGKVTRSPYSFDIVTSGPHALGRTKEGRLFQSTDHGASWVEVATPPSGVAASDMRACSSAGCDLGGFYRVGWAERPPRAEVAPAQAPRAAEVRRTPAVELSCRVAGPAQVKVLPRTQNSPEDLGLGESRLPVAGDRGDVSFVRSAIARSIVHPLHDPLTGDSDVPALRALLSGYAATREGDTLEVAGPNKSAAALRRTFAFVPPFDPAAPVKKAFFAMSEVIAAGRAAGMANEDILSDDMTESGSVVVLTPSDAASPSELAFCNARGLLVRVRPTERVKAAMRAPQNEGTVISGVALSNDEAAFLELESGGVGHVFKVGAGGVADLFDVNPSFAESGLYPANPDALAVGPRGHLAIVRTASGSDPASDKDPALLVVTSMPAVVLAPWSTLRPADDASCKADAGWRTTLQTIAPWIRVTTPELRTEDVPMIARVKWSERRVCLEGFEVKLPDVSVRASMAYGSESLKIPSWLVSRGGAFARVAIGEGVEWRQPLECTFVTPQAARAP